jgi:hypothetical protein
MRKFPCLASVIIVLVLASFNVFGQPKIISGRVLPGSTNIHIESVAVLNTPTVVIQNKGLVQLAKATRITKLPTLRCPS